MTDIEILGMLLHRLERTSGDCSVHVLHDLDLPIYMASRGPLQGSDQKRL
uniref:Uncharacterized protein n=1 Tax=Lepeophtheirus salmonis TaxID=72036 RepID=A0A0K2U1K9_LEPSM